MGQPKALLICPATGRTFVTQLVGALLDGGLDRVAVVGRPADADLQRELAAAAPGVPYLENPSHELGQLSSLLVGIAFAESIGADAALVVPVDMPLVSPAAVRTALGAFAASTEPMLRVTCQGRHGHPVIFGESVFAELRVADPAIGARAVLRRDPARVRNVEVDDPWVLRDIDVPAEYRAVFGRDPSPA
jgi:molybdenum cofactor cytidylyltransferase